MTTTEGHALLVKHYPDKFGRVYTLCSISSKNLHISEILENINKYRSGLGTIYEHHIEKIKYGVCNQPVGADLFVAFREDVYSQVCHFYELKFSLSTDNN